MRFCDVGDFQERKQKADVEVAVVIGDNDETLDLPEVLTPDNGNPEHKLQERPKEGDVDELSQERNDGSRTPLCEKIPDIVENDRRCVKN